jgi:hypothetical protein
LEADPSRDQIDGGDSGRRFPSRSVERRCVPVGASSAIGAFIFGNIASSFASSQAHIEAFDG